MKWYEFPDVRVKTTFRWNAMSQTDYDSWVVEEEKLLKLSEVGEFAEGLKAYGYDLFKVAWLNLVRVRSGQDMIFTRGSLERYSENQMRVVVKPKKVDVSQATPEFLEALEKRCRAKPQLTHLELVERERLGVEWLRCNVADEAYAEDSASKEELDSWRAHQWMVSPGRSEAANEQWEVKIDA